MSNKPPPTPSPYRTPRYDALAKKQDERVWRVYENRYTVDFITKFGDLHPGDIVLADGLTLAEAISIADRELARKRQEVGK